VCAPLLTFAQIVPPKPGVELPQAYFDRVAQDKTVFQFQKAWIQKAQRAKEAREVFLSMPHPQGHAMSLATLPDDIRRSMMVSGTTYVPVLMGKYSNTGTDPYAVSTLQTKLFTPSGTSMTDLYHEMSYGNLDVDGTVYDWVPVSNNDTYYEGGCNGLCGSAKTGQFILELLQANDASVDFGLYDNDGPDGLPNSGDDDGYVDFIAIVHPETGGECGTTNLWSHRWVVTGWPEFSQPWATNDSRTGGGVIRVLDYTLMPALGSGGGCGTGITEIGVYCHEFGHAFGLPDFYDTNGGSEGIGEWGLMGSGNWQTSTNPAHMSAYSKTELGWIIPTEVGPVTQSYTINNAEVNAEAYKLNVMEERFVRSGDFPLGGSVSMTCGLNAADASARSWPGGAGYGNEWDEAVRREFSYNGSDPVTLEYDYAYHTEADYDYCHVKIDVDGTVSTLATYDGIKTKTHATISLTPYLSGSGASSYELIFQLTSDYAYADEDGNFNSGGNGPFKFDDVSVTGGGESYFTDFEAYEDGWHYDRTKNPVKEYFLVENRNTAGAQFNQFPNGEGMLIFHIEHDVMNSTLGNSGGSSNNTTRGKAVEEADNLGHLRNGLNRGDTGDVFPGSTSNTTFNNSTSPNSLSHNSNPTMALVENISPAGAVMTADMRGGCFAPVLNTFAPVTAENNQIVPVSDVSGAGFVFGATFLLRDVSMTEYAASNVEWIGKAKLVGDLDLNGVPAGYYDVVVRNPDGQEAVIEDGFEVTSTASGLENPGFAASNKLHQNHPNPFNPTTTIRYSIKEQGHVTLKVYNAAGQLVRTLVDDMQAPRAGGFAVVWNGRNDAGISVASGVYMYRLTAGNQFQDVRKLVLLK
jgi:M6 family metalloprotease-like protein